MANGYVDIIKAEDNTKMGTVYGRKRNGRTYIVYHTRTDLYYTVNRDGSMKKVA